MSELLFEAGTHYTRNERQAVEYGFQRFEYQWIVGDSLGTSFVWCDNQAALLRLLNRWNGNRSQFKYWY